MKYINTLKTYAQNDRRIIFLLKSKYARFFVTGASGVGINLVVTWTLTTFYFGLEKYFFAYMIGLTLNLIYNFVLHSFLTFKTNGYHGRRFAIFFLYSLFMTFIQAVTVKWITPMVGLKYYIFVIAIVILAFSTLNFFIFKYKIFKE